MTSIPSSSRGSGFANPLRRGTAVTLPAGNRERLWLPVGIVLAAVLGLAGWMLLVSPLRGETAAVQDQTASVTQQVDSLQSQLATLQSQQADLPRYRAELKAAQAALPTTAALPAFLRSLQDLGTGTGVAVTAMTATAPDAGTAAGGDASAAIGNVYRIPVTVTAAGDYAALTSFVKGLQERQPRAVLVTSVSETAGVAATTLTISMTAFVAPTAGATTGG